MIGLFRKRFTSTLLLLGFVSLPVTTAWAADSCIKTDNQCDPDKLCTFRAELASKKLAYDTWAANRTSKGPLYRAAMAQATADLPHGTPAEIAAQAGANLEKLVGDDVRMNFKLPECEEGMLDRTLVPKPGYTGMHTDPKCKVWVDFEAGLYEPEGFGANDKTSCPEFYDRDRAHEAIHKNLCEAAKDPKNKKKIDRESIGEIAREEVLAYSHSVKLTEAYVRLLSLQCSSGRTPDKLKARAKQIQQALAPYVAKAK
jgi:hypothetical protein